MMLAISILLGIAFLISAINSFPDYNILILAALIISLWESCLPLAIIFIVIGIILGLFILRDQ